MTEIKPSSTFNLTPRQIVAELDRYIIGQAAAKRAVAIALRNRWRRLQTPEDLRDEISPKNIIMIGPTGVGKTEIARRLAKMTRSPFIKVEASKYTEIGYVGRDVESMIRDLMELAVRLVQEEERSSLLEKAGQAAEERLLDALLPSRAADGLPDMPFQALGLEHREAAERPAGPSTRDKLRRLLKEGRLNEREIEIEVEPGSGPVMGRLFSNLGLEEMEKNLSEMMAGVFPKKKRRRKVTVKEARELLINEEASRMVDMEKVANDAKIMVEQHGIIFIDEIDKVAGRESKSGPDISREGVQRDLLPLVEGSTVPTKYGPIKTDHILFIASGAFHLSKPSDLIPELQGRFPIRVELGPLGQDEFSRILTEPENALTTQYKALLATEGVTLEFSGEAVETIAEVATVVNEKNENIGARRLATILEKILDELSFEAPDMGSSQVTITGDYVRERLGDLVRNTDLARYIL